MPETYFRPFFDILILSETVFASRERVSGFPEKGADLRGSPGNFQGSPGNFRGSLGNFRGTLGLLLGSTVRELPGKSPKNFWGSLGNFRGSPGDFPEARGSLLPSQRLAKSVSNFNVFGVRGPLGGLLLLIRLGDGSSLLNYARMQGTS